MTQQIRTPSLTDVIRAALEQFQAGLNVCLPGQLVSYDVATQKGEVQPLLQRPLVDVDGNDIPAEVLPRIPDVPIVFPRSGEYFVSLPMKVGDLVTLFFVQNSIDAFMTKPTGAAITDPVDLRMHDLSDAIAFPGLYPFSQSLGAAHADNLVIGNNTTGTVAHFKATEIHLGEENALQFVSLSDKTNERIKAVEDNLNDLRSQYTNFVTTVYAFHTHITTATVGPSAAPGTIAPTTSQDLGVPVPYPNGSSVAASKVKAT